MAVRAIAKYTTHTHTPSSSHPSFAQYHTSPASLSSASDTVTAGGDSGEVGLPSGSAGGGNDDSSTEQVLACEEDVLVTA